MLNNIKNKLQVVQVSVGISVLFFRKKGVQDFNRVVACPAGAVEF